MVELHAQCADEAPIIVSYGKTHTRSVLNEKKVVLRMRNLDKLKCSLVRAPFMSVQVLFWVSHGILTRPAECCSGDTASGRGRRTCIGSPGGR